MSNPFETYARNLCSSYRDKSCQLDMRHRFLRIEDEANLERMATFSSPESIQAINNIVNEYSKMIEPEIIIASIGTSSTQIYDKNRVIGTILIGSDVLGKSKSAPSEFLLVLSRLMKSCDCSNTVVLLCNSIGYYVPTTFNLSTPCDVASNFEEFFSLLKKCGLEIIAISSNHNVFSNSWIPIAAKTISSLFNGDEIPSNFFLVDFGGGGTKIYYVDTAASSILPVAKDKYLREVQNEFVSEVLDIQSADSQIFKHVREFLTTQICDYCVAHEISIAFCYILQTGKLRQAYFEQSFSCK